VSAEQIARSRSESGSFWVASRGDLTDDDDVRGLLDSYDLATSSG
jgi:hypothetical protein